MDKPIAIITGVNGQDGSYLAEFLLDKDYTVIGVMRRSSTDNRDERLKGVIGRECFTLIEGDVTDPSNMSSLLSVYHPQEFYNLAAQSHVQTSFEQPNLTWQIDAVGVLNILEGIKQCSPKTKFYQASTSEMFGSNVTFKYNIEGHSVRYDGLLDRTYDCYAERNGFMTMVPTSQMDGIYQDEDTPLSPNSPYAVAKVAAHNMVGLYRKAYNLHASCGILFNHETLTSGTPLIYKTSSGLIDILPIGDIARFQSGISFNMNNKSYQGGVPQKDIWVWDYNGWTKVKYVSGYPHIQDDPKYPRIINARNAVYTATNSHICIMENGTEVRTDALNIGDKVKLISLPEQSNMTNISIEEAKWLGMLVGDGNLHNKIPRFTNKDMAIMDVYTHELSPFGHKAKKVPQCILNGSKDIMEAFLIGYNICDGLKKNGCTYRFKNFKTNSHTLAAGLIYLIYCVTGQKYNLTVEESFKYGKRQFYYSINLLSDNVSSVDKYHKVKALLATSISHRQIHRDTGISRLFIRKVSNGYIPSNTHRLELCNNEIKKIIEIPEYDGWFFDLETCSGTFHAGAGQGLVHNSERRGSLFVTRKITKWIGQYKAWVESHRGVFEQGQLRLADDLSKIYISPFDPIGFAKLRLGNIDAVRDWGHAKDYVRAMWMMLQREIPEDYVVATKSSYSVRDFLNVAFEKIGLDYKDYIVQDPAFMRPSEVPYLCGNPRKIQNMMGWVPYVSFEQLVHMMVDYDIQKESKL